MARRDSDPDFIEAIARGLDVITAFGPAARTMSLSEVATSTGLARPTARRILRTLEMQGYVHSVGGSFALTPKVMDLGMSYVRSMGLWPIARPHMEALVRKTHESTSIAQLDGSDIIYTCRVAVPKLVTLAVEIGTRFPAMQTSLGRVLLAALSDDEVEQILAEPNRSRIEPRWKPTPAERVKELSHVRAQGWALADEELAPGVRSIAAPIRDGAGRVIAALNVNAHAAETSVKTLVDEHLPRLLHAASDISADWAKRGDAPMEIDETFGHGA